LALFPSRNRPVTRPRARAMPVMAVGHRVFVHCAGNRLGSVPLADVSGKVLSAVHLADGSAVEVVAWRPRGASDTRYRVRAPHGVDGWLPAENLRPALVPLPPPETPTPAQATPGADASGPRFGQRFQPERPPAYGPRMPEPPTPVAGGGRRFGQHFETEASPASGSPTSAAPPAPVVSAGGRRFGQHF